MKKQIVIAGIGAVVTAGAFYSLRAANTQELNNPKSIPARVASGAATPARTDGGKLDASDLQLSQARTENRSTRYVISNVVANQISLPVTSDHAAIGVFSSDPNVQAALTAPSGGAASLQAVPRDESLEPSLALPQGKMEALPRQAATEPGLYTLQLNGLPLAGKAAEAGASPTVSVVVNDRNDLVLRTWLSDDMVDVSQGAEIRASIAGGGALKRASLIANVYHQDGRLIRTIPLKATSNGEFAGRFRALDLGRMANIVIQAEGVTAQGLAFRRTGNLEFVSGAAGCQLTGVLGETVTKETLDVNVGFEALAAGRFYLRANLVNAEGKPVAWAQAAVNAEPGAQTLTLHFDRGLLSPGQTFVVRDIELTNVTDMPGVKSLNKIGDYAVKTAF
jgi:hypothetical protein